MRKSTVRLSRFPMTRLPWKGVLAAVFLAGFLSGILAANWVGQERLIQYGLLNEYEVGRICYADFRTGDYLLYLAGRRLRVFAVLVFLGFTGFGTAALIAAVCGYAFSLGYVFVNALVCMGFNGMALVLVSLFPHVFFYIAACVQLAKNQIERKWEPESFQAKQPAWKRTRLFLLASAFAALLVGVWLEGAVNPLLLQGYIRRM